MVVVAYGHPDPVNHDDTLDVHGGRHEQRDERHGPGAIVRVVLPATGVGSMAVAAIQRFSCAKNMTVDRRTDVRLHRRLRGGRNADRLDDDHGDDDGRRRRSASGDDVGDRDRRSRRMRIAESDETNNTKTESTASAAPSAVLRRASTFHARDRPAVRRSARPRWGRVLHRQRAERRHDRPSRTRRRRGRSASRATGALITSVVPPAGVVCTPAGRCACDLFERPGRPRRDGSRSGRRRRPSR